MKLIFKGTLLGLPKVILLKCILQLTKPLKISLSLMKIIVLYSLPLTNKICNCLKLDVQELKDCKTTNRQEAWADPQVRKE